MVISAEKDMSIITDCYKVLNIRVWQVLLQSPARISILGFAILISIGTGLLMIPSATNTHNLGFIDALFTSTSAACVTGLVVVEKRFYSNIYKKTLPLAFKNGK